MRPFCRPPPSLWGLLALPLAACDAHLGKPDIDPRASTALDDLNEPSGDGDDSPLSEAQDPLRIGCDIQAVMAKPENSCTAGGCHGARPEAGLDLLSVGVEERLVGISSQSEECGGEQLIDLENPDQSLILRKIDPARFGGPGQTCGGIMPLNSEGVSADDLSCFEKWVEALAEVNEPVEEDTFEDDWEDSSVESYLSKVKALTNGGVVTAEELSSVRADPTTLSSYVEGWVQTPSFELKLHDFLETALQQTLVGDLVDQADSLNFPIQRRRLLYANLEESFARTARKIVLSGRPFTDVTTTTEWEMTTALLVLLSYTEYDDDEKNDLRHWVYKDDPPDGAPAGPTTLNQSVQTGYWYIADMPNNCSTRSLRGGPLLDFLFGRFGCNPGAYVADQPLIADGDFSDWRTVSMVPSTSKAERTRFWDLPKLRNTTELAVALPRVGFFTTPAFLANWATNEDNQFRVAASQTMITGLGREFSAGDLTTPLTLAGLAEEHAEPGTSCYACHALLDPMRNYFAESFSFKYQRPTAPEDLDAGFAFRGAATEGGDIYDFAAYVASHPLFGAAWVQKLCYYANSQSCDEGDPEFLRIVEEFESSNFDFKGLFVDLMSSPLVTGASYTKTYERKRWLISITRQNHLCRMLDERLGYENVCGEGANFIGLIPEDEFSRGQAMPVQTAVTGSFHFAAADALCNRLSFRLIGNQEGRLFRLDDIDGSIQLMIDGLLGLPEGHSRRAEWSTTLSEHFDAARDAGANNNQALRSAFTLACTSPEVMALGL